MKSRAKQEKRRDIVSITTKGARYGNFRHSRASGALLVHELSETHLHVVEGVGVDCQGGVGGGGSGDLGNVVRGDVVARLGEDHVLCGVAAKMEKRRAKGSEASELVCVCCYVSSTKRRRAKRRYRERISWIV